MRGMPGAGLRGLFYEGEGELAQRECFVALRSASIYLRPVAGRAQAARAVGWTASQL
jgi:hypothetical protein